MADGLHADVEAREALLGLVAHAGLVGIDEVVLAVFVGGEVGHDDIGASHDGLFSSHGVNGLVGSGRHHVDFRHHQP